MADAHPCVGGAERDFRFPLSFFAAPFVLLFGHQPMPLVGHRRELAGGSWRRFVWVVLFAKNRTNLGLEGTPESNLLAAILPLQFMPEE